MSDMTDVTYIISDKNFVTEGDVTFSDGYYSIYYYFLTSKSELSASNAEKPGQYIFKYTD